MSDEKYYEYADLLIRKSWSGQLDSKKAVRFQKKLAEWWMND